MLENKLRKYISELIKEVEEELEEQKPQVISMDIKLRIFW